MKRKPNEAHLLMQDILEGLDLWQVPEHRFDESRRWRFDFAIPTQKLGIEIHGAVWVRGGHTRGQGFQDDREKMNAAQVLGWSVLEFTTQDVLQGRAAATIKAWLEAREK